MRVRELAAKRGVCLAFIAIDAQAATNTAAPASQGGGNSLGGSGAAAAGAGEVGMEGSVGAQGGSHADTPQPQHQHQQQPQSQSSAAGRRGGTERASGAGSQGGGSLLDMQTVSFVGGKPVFRKYMDDFPFPYYVLLRDIGALPRTLADMLRQWFEMSASS